MPSPDSIRIITVIAFVVFLAIGIRKPLWAVIAYMILVYCKVSSYYPFFASIEAEAIFGVAILLRVMASGDGIAKLSAHYNEVNRYLLFFVGCIFISFIIAWDHRYSWDNAVYHFIKILFFYVMVLGAINDKQDIKVFIWSFVIMFSYLAYEPIFGFLTGTGASKQVYGDIYVGEVGLLSGHVALANNMNQIIPIVFFLIPSVKNKTLRIFATILLLLFITAIIGSGSRGGVIGLMAFGATLVYFSKNRLRNGVALALIFVMLFGFSYTFKSTGSRIDRNSVERRLIGLIHGIEMIRLKGHFLGVGPGCFLLARGKYFGYTMESHNIYGEILGDLGIPGAIVWTLLIFQIFRNLKYSKEKLKMLGMDKNFLYRFAMAIQVSLIVRLFISLASHGLYYFYWYVIAALSISLLKIIERIEENIASDEKNMLNLSNA